MTASGSVTSHRQRRGLGAMIVMVACVAACALPIVGGAIAGTFVDRLLDVPAWVVVLVAVAAGTATWLTVRRRQA